MKNLKSHQDSECEGIHFLIPKDTSEHIIKVVGVGGGGCNAVRNMYQEETEEKVEVESTQPVTQHHYGMA